MTTTKVRFADLDARAKTEVKALAARMATIEPTPFRLEAFAIFQLRARRCLEGKPWHAAHVEARIVVRVALNVVRDVRPSWLDGQPIPTANAAESCQMCAGPLYGASASDPRAREKRMCSDLCWRRYAKQLESARLATARAGARCARCGKPFERA
jgi:hypothetical protein